jgi:hypothetical protein
VSRDFAEDILDRCYIAVKHYDGRPNGAWSTGEQLAVALVLDDHDHLGEMGYTVLEAAERVRGGMILPPEDILAWLKAIRAQLDETLRQERRS